MTRPRNDSSRGERPTLNIGHLSTFYHTCFVLMETPGFEEEMGGNVNWYLFGTGPEMVEAFKAGRIDAGYLGLPPAIIGMDRGVDFTCVASGHVEGTVLVSTDEYNDISKFNDDLYAAFAQFKDKRIGVTSKGSIHDVILRYYLKKAGVADRVEVFNYPQAELIAVAMMNGEVDAGVGTPALAVFAATLMEGTKIIIHPSYLWPYNPSYGVFFRRRYIEEKPEMVRKFLDHHARAAKFIMEKPGDAAEMIARQVKVASKEFIEEVLKISPKYFTELTDQYVKTTMDFVRALHKLGYISRELSKEEIFTFKV